MDIQTLMRVPPDQHDINWLKSSLQSATELEFATIPPYLCALWSIIDESGPVYRRIRGIVLQEMLHMGLACNMLTTIGGTPNINGGSAVPSYPGSLPGGVRPRLTVPLQGLSKDAVRNVFMQIEYPEQPLALAETYPTIGAFYDAILAAVQRLSPSAITGARQLENDILGLTKLTNQTDVEQAIALIKEQGEGTDQSPFATDFGGGLAHYYTFGEIYHGRTFTKTASGKWDWVGDDVPFPKVFPMAPVPKGGYAESRPFDLLFSAMLGNLQAAWAGGNQDQLDTAVTAMKSLAGPARDLMQKPLPSGKGNFGPSFLLIA
jgi:Ferritin-like